MAAGMTRHLQVKLVLLALAGVCWFFVHTGQEMEIEFNLPLELRLDLPEGRVLISPPPSQVQALLRGRGRNLLLFALFGQGVCRVDAHHGGESLVLSAKQVELAGAVDLAVVGLTPAQLTLDVDRVESRRLPVRLAGHLEAAEGLVLVDQRLEPERVKVTGPRRVLDTLVCVLTEEVDLPHRKRDVEESLVLRAPWPSLRLEPDRVTLSARVEERAERRFTGIPLRVLNLPAPLGVRPRALSLTVVGGAAQLEDLEKSAIEAVLDYELIEPEQVQAPCRITLPEGLHWTNPEPALFRIVGRRPRPAREAPPADSLAPEQPPQP
jgi:hypothetical protein